MAAPGSRRGAALKPEARTALIGLCLQNKDSSPFTDHTKQFWIRMSAEFLKLTGRPYSWQSCRRQMVNWELDKKKNTHTPSTELLPHASANRPSDGHTRHHSHSSFPSRHGRSFSSDESPAGETDGDGFLPRMPVRPFRRPVGERGRLELENDALRRGIHALVKTSFDGFEGQLQCLLAAFVDDLNDQRGVRIALDNLRNEVLKAIKEPRKPNDQK